MNIRANKHFSDPAKCILSKKELDPTVSAVNKNTHPGKVNFEQRFNSRASGVS